MGQGQEGGFGEQIIRLVVWRGGIRGREFIINEGANLVGRWDPENGAFPEIDLEADDKESKVSRKHAVIERHGSSVTIEDLGSLNGTYINRGSKLTEGNKHPLQHGDEVIVGKTFLKLEVVE